MRFGEQWRAEAVSPGASRGRHCGVCSVENRRLKSGVAASSGMIFSGFLPRHAFYLPCI